MKTLSTKEKSVHINIDSEYYGTIAEIGGGQETARHLFQAGGASNTVAKSVSAYDKLFSDHFYNQGESSRYVAEDRLLKMLDYEYEELISILDKKNPQKFFAFANTVETLNFTKTNQGNGWLGMAVEGSDRYRPNKILIHIKLLENDTLLQQYTLGTLGINLIYGGLFRWEDPRKILLSMLDNLDTSRVEIDYIYVEGPDMTWVDNRLLSLMLVSHGMTPAVMFDKDGKVCQPGDMLHRKNVSLMRGYFRPINNLGLEFLEDSMKIFCKDEDYTPDNTIAFCEISLKYLMQSEKEINEKDFLHRVDLLNSVGQSVMISNFRRYFQLVNYFAQFRMMKLRIVLGLPTFEKILMPEYYNDLKGGVLEAVGAMFQDNVKIYLYPAFDPATGEITLPDDNYFNRQASLLWKYFKETHKIILLRSISTKNLSITTEKVIDLIENASPELAELVPEKVYELIVEKKLFDYGKNLAAADLN